MVGPTSANGIVPIKDQKFAVSDEFKTPFWGNCMQNAAKIYIWQACLSGFRTKNPEQSGLRDGPAR